MALGPSLNMRPRKQERDRDSNRVRTPLDPPHEEQGSGRLGPKMRRSNVAYGVSGTLGGGRRSGEREMRPR
jgi:hypothetical protein